MGLFGIGSTKVVLGAGGCIYDPVTQKHIDELSKLAPDDCPLLKRAAGIQRDENGFPIPNAPYVTEVGYVFQKLFRPRYFVFPTCTNCEVRGNCGESLESKR